MPSESTAGAETEALADKIHDYFRDYGWQCEFDSETTTWVTGFRGKATNFNVLLHLTDNWLYFIISPFVNAPQTSACEQRVNEYLLRLNHTVNLAKFSVDVDGDVVLTVEFPTEALTYTHFRDGLNAVSYYADNYFLEILNLAQDPDYVPIQPGDEPAWSEFGADLELDKPN